MKPLQIDWIRHLDRYAVVGGHDWIASIIRGLNKLVEIEMRRFAAEDKASAWQWLQA